MTEAAQVSFARIADRHPTAHFTPHATGKGGYQVHSACGSVDATVYADGLVVERSAGRAGPITVYLPDGTVAGTQIVDVVRAVMSE